jgi:glycolate oxidase FAD binding subunit
MPEVPDLSKLTTALPSAILSFDGAERYAIDGMTPSVVVKPGSQAEVAAVLRAANEADAAVVPFGGGTQQGLGMPPSRYDVALDLTEIDTLIEHEPADLTVTVEAGMRLSRLQELLGEKGQWLPFDPPVDEAATIGGVLATNASGPARLSRGTARDLVIGMTVATAQGEIVKSGGRVVKNVAGYDLAKLHIGALGTTAVILQVSLKVSPLPVRTSTAGAQGDIEALLRLSAAVESARLPLEGSVLSKEASASTWRLALRFAAGEAAVERSMRETLALASEASLQASEMTESEWRAMQDTYPAEGVVVRASVLPSDVRGVAEALSGAGAAVSTLPGVGIAYGAWPGEVATDTLRSLRAMCESKQGALVVERAPVSSKRAIDVWGAPRGGFELMKRLKQEMDPGETLNPGRFVGGI